MKNTDLLEALGQIPSAPVWIASPILKHGDRKDIREFSARATDEGDTRMFILDDTFRDFQRANFTLDKGCELRDDTGHYRCIEVIPIRSMRKIHPALVTQRIT